MHYLHKIILTSIAAVGLAMMPLGHRRMEPKPHPEVVRHVAKRKQPIRHRYLLLTEGLVSYYTRASSGPVTASGEPMRDDLPTCAMRTVKFQTWVTVQTKAGKHTACRVNDRGPNVPGRVVDLSKESMRRLGFANDLAYVHVYVRER